MTSPPPICTSRPAALAPPADPAPHATLGRDAKTIAESLGAISDRWDQGEPPTVREIVAITETIATLRAGLLDRAAIAQKHPTARAEETHDPSR